MKVVSVFNNNDNIKKLTSELSAAGINNIHIRKLSNNYRQEIIEEIFISNNEKYGFLIGVLIGATLGVIISYLTNNDILILPLLLRLEAAGMIAVSFFWITSLIILGGFFGALIGLAYSNLQVDEEDKMLIVYCDSGKRARAKSIIDKYNGQIQ